MIATTGEENVGTPTTEYENNRPSRLLGLCYAFKKIRKEVLTKGAVLRIIKIQNDKEL